MGLVAAVVGAASVRWGETPVAYIVLRAGAETSEAALREHCRARMAGFKVPSAVCFIAELPKTATGKIQKYVLRKQRSAINPQ